jgi:hypothetical protein
MHGLNQRDVKFAEYRPWCGEVVTVNDEGIQHTTLHIGEAWFCYPDTITAKISAFRQRQIRETSRIHHHVIRRLVYGALYHVI